MVQRFKVLSSDPEYVSHTEGQEGRVVNRGDVNKLWDMWIGSRDLSEDEEVALLNEQLKVQGKRKIWTLHMLYLTSKRWRRIRKEILERDGYACVECGSVQELCVDHKRYTGKFGDEVAEDLQTLCFSHHARKTKRFQLGAWSSKAVILDIRPDSQLFSALRRGNRGVVETRIEAQTGRYIAVANVRRAKEGEIGAH